MTLDDSLNSNIELDEEENKLEDFFPNILINNEEKRSSIIIQNSQCTSQQNSKKPFVLRWLIIAQCLTTALTLFSAAHIHWVISETEIKVKLQCSETAIKRIRSKRNLQEKPRFVAGNISATIEKINENTGNSMWVHSLSKIQVKKCVLTKLFLKFR